jgi:hypothetical protein
MSLACGRISGNNIFAAMIPNVGCKTTPTVQRIVATTATAALSETISLSLDAAYVAGGYTAASSIRIYANTILFFGASLLPVTVLEDYFLTTSAQAVRIAPVTTAIALNATADSYLAARICSETFNITSPPQTVATNENCQDLLTDTITGVKRVASISGMPNAKSGSYWDVIVKQGRALGYVFYCVVYDGKYAEFGNMQISSPDFQEGGKATIQKFQVSGQISDYKDIYPNTEKTPAQVLIDDNRLRLYGFAPLAA